MTLTADGTLVLERGDVDAILGATATRLDPAGLEQAWSAILRSGVFVDGDLTLPGFARQTVTTATNEFLVDDGSRSTRLVIDDLGSEAIFRGDPPMPEAEMGLRAAATRLMDDLRALDGGEPWTPPALLLWWRSEAPADWDASIVSWSPAIDLGRAGRSVEHPVWDRCARLDGDEAAGVARFAQILPIDHLVEQDGLRYVIDVRPIHPDEIDQVACP
jgi:hypothetical protein